MIKEEMQDKPLNYPGERKTKPNILIIYPDQHRIDCLGAYGNQQVKTPHIDNLAKDGVRFENSFCTFSMCTPSRYSLISGLYAHEHRGWNNLSTLPPEVETFPAILKRSGYRTKAVGKMHYTPTYLDVGFEEMVLAEQGLGRWDDDYHRELRRLDLVDRNELEDQEVEYRKQARREYWENCGALPSNLPEKYHSTTWIGDRAVETVEQWGDSGNLLLVGFIKPHHPFDPPEPWSSMYDPEKISLLPGWTEECLLRDLAYYQNGYQGFFPHKDLTEQTIRRVTAYYYATISQVDYQVGRIIDVLKRRGIYDNTLIIFTSDHGEYLGYHHMLTKGNYMYEPLMKVPLIIKYPGGKQGGTVSQAMVSTVDIAPTVLRQAGYEPPCWMKGIDLAQDTEGREIVFASAGRDKHMARTRTHKLILVGENKQSLFFNLLEDPFELKNLYDKVPKKEIQKYVVAIEEWLGPGELPPVYLDENAPQIRMPNVPPVNDNHREELKAYYRRKMMELMRADFIFDKTTQIIEGN